MLVMHVLKAFPNRLNTKKQVRRVPATNCKKTLEGMVKLRSLLGDKKINYRPLDGFEIFKSTDHQLINSCVSKIEHYNI